jgi:hypothetical protein
MAVNLIDVIRLSQTVSTRRLIQESIVDIGRMLRDFRRHYHKCKAVYSALVERGSLSLHIDFREGRLSAANEVPQPEEMMRFVVLMRRFLSPLDQLYYASVWQTLKGHFAEAIPVDVQALIELGMDRVKKGYLGININGETLTAEKVYQLVSDGEFFGTDEQAQDYLSSLVGLPVAGPVFLHQFYEYTLSSFRLMSAIFDIVLDLETSERYRVLCESKVLEERCIYCLSTTGPFASEEHVYPESLGNADLILPRGYVCDRCNNGILSELDNALLRFDPITFLQVLFVPYTKEGKLPRANLQNIAMRRTGPRNIAIQAKDKSGWMKNRRALGEGWYSFSMQGRGKRFSPRLLGRTLYKVGLGMVAFSQGHEQACQPRFDAARSFILRNQGIPNNLLMQMQTTPRPHIEIRYHDLGEGTVFAIDLMGLVFILNLENVPALELTEELARLHFESFSLLE